nr:GNAT family N-acetyltransferase [Paenibacillus senegalimassiliensis]
MPLLGELYQAITTQGNAIFWWIGEKEHWENVYCAFENGKMVAKGQVSIINTVPPGRPTENYHSIYINLKALPQRETDYDLLDQVYQALLQRVRQLQATLPAAYETRLCVGNLKEETANEEFFVQRGFNYLNSLFSMSRSLKEAIPTAAIPNGLSYSPWSMGTPEEESIYLNIEAEVWPDTPLGHDRLAKYKSKPYWISLVVREEDQIVASLMVWQEAGYGVIENVFVRKPWRQRGIAKYLLAQALSYLQARDLPYASLMALTTNHSALTLYQSLGFTADQEEIRYFITL